MGTKKIKEIEKLGKKGQETLFPDEMRITVGLSTCGVAAGGNKVFAALKKSADEEGLKVHIEPVGCVGLCFEEPLVNVYKPEYPMVTYAKVDSEMARAIVKELAGGKVPAAGAIYRQDVVENALNDKAVSLVSNSVPKELESIPFFNQLDFTKDQLHYIMRNCGLINPDEIEQYIARGGYSSLIKALTSMSPDEVIAQVEDANLRGRGGGGFPTGFKWRACRNAHGAPKYVLCNADEGNPGAFMDRTLLESDPHAIIEGMVIGAYGIGASEGFIYARHEYPRAIERLERAISQSRAYGLLGQDILGTGFQVDIKINRGAGAYVCGESTALMTSIEGKSGEPRVKYIHTSDVGLWGRPSTLNNVETWANVPLIIGKGADWYQGIGSAGNSGTKIFSLGGRIKRGGLVEVPLGIPLRKLIFEIGGGMSEEGSFKAVQSGGPSGGTIPDELLDTPADFDSLKKVGAEMGAGGMVVLDDTNCMVDITRYTLSFLMEESCGKCIPCRLGLKGLRDMVENFSKGMATMEDTDEMESLSRAVMDGSLCGLGGAAPNCVLTTIRYFRDEYEAHILDKKCPAGVCRELSSS